MQPRKQSPFSFPFVALIETSAVMVTTALFLSACGSGDKSAEQAADRPAPPVEALQARSGTLPLEERLNGVVKARNQVAVRPKISAHVVEVLVNSGQQVERGQALVRLDDDAVREQLRQAEANFRLTEAAERESQARLAELEAQVVRSRALAEQELVSDLDLETLEARLNAAVASAEQAAARVDEARATVDERKADLDRTVVRSPLTGNLGRRRVEVGMGVDPDTVLFQVGSLDRVMVEVPLTEHMLSFLQPGQTALVSPRDSDVEPLRAELSRISPFLEGGSFSTVGEIDVEDHDGRLRPGMFVRVDLLYGETAEATLVPSSALWDDPRTGLMGVYVIENLGNDPPPELSERAYAVELRTVEVLATGRSSVGLRGVEPEEWVVTVGQHLLAGENAPSARVRPTTWERVADLQGLQREDLLRGFLDKQKRLAQTLGAGIPDDPKLLRDPKGADTSGGSATSFAEAAPSADRQATNQRGD